MQLSNDDFLTVICHYICNMKKSNYQRKWIIAIVNLVSPLIFWYWWVLWMKYQFSWKFKINHQFHVSFTLVLIPFSHLFDKYYYNLDDLSHGKCTILIKSTLPNRQAVLTDLFGMWLHTSGEWCGITVRMTDDRAKGNMEKSRAREREEEKR